MTAIHLIIKSAHKSGRIIFILRRGFNYHQLYDAVLSYCFTVDKRQMDGDGSELFCYFYQCDEEWVESKII